MSPTANGRAWRTLFQKAPTVWPDSVRPDWSVMVPLTITGRREPSSSKSASTAKMAALPLSVSKIVSMSRMSAPPVDQAARRLEVRGDQLVPGDVARAGIVDVGRERGASCWSARASRPRSGACRVVRSVAASAASRAIEAAALVHLLGERLEPVVGHARSPLALKVLVLMMSAPASRYSSWMLADDLRLGQDERLVGATQVVRVVR